MKTKPKVGEIWKLEGMGYYLLVGNKKDRKGAFLQYSLDGNNYRGFISRNAIMNDPDLYLEIDIKADAVYSWDNDHMRHDSYGKITRKVKDNKLTRKLYNNKIEREEKGFMFVYCTDDTDIKTNIS